MKKFCFIVFIIVTIFCFIPYHVHAEDEGLPSCPALPRDTSQISASFFGITLENTGDNEYELRIGNNKGLTFAVEKCLDAAYPYCFYDDKSQLNDGTDTSSYPDPEELREDVLVTDLDTSNYSITATDHDYYTNYELIEGLTLRLSAQCSKGKNSAGNEEIATIYIIIPKEEKKEPISYTYSDSQALGLIDSSNVSLVNGILSNLNKKPFDCNNSSDLSDPFVRNYCATLNKVSAANKEPKINTEKFASDYIKKYTCDSNVDSVYAGDQNTEGDYFERYNKIYASGENSYTLPTNVSPANCLFSDNTCGITCEEVIETDFGPPIASKAGMCFEYNVRVTSRSFCYVSKYPSPPTTPSVCVPVPTCVHTDASIGTAAGPNDDFDECIMNCDNGKYTNKCTKECYKKVYGNSLKMSYQNKIYNDLYATKTKGYTGNTWSAITSYDKVGAWYKQNFSESFIKNGTWVVDSNGFLRKKWGSTVCDADCSWSQCSDSCPEYSSAEAANAAYQEAYASYVEAVKDCDKMKVTCSTSETTLAIGVDLYDKNSQPAGTMEFPSAEKSNTDSTGDSFPISSPSKVKNINNIINYFPSLTDTKSILLPKMPTINEQELGILGCYNANNDSIEIDAKTFDSTYVNLYRLTWGLPGTWINNKSGEISYKKNGNCGTEKGQSCSWRYMKNKFCLPNNTGRVNADWWNEYYNKILTNLNLITDDKSSLSIDSVVEKCGGRKTNTIVNPKTPYNIEKNNIHATTRGFGQLGWNINVDCFYATNPAPLTPTDQSTSTTSKECRTDSEYRIRSIDLENVFPAVDGSDTLDKSTYGRLPGHNWTKYSNPNATDPTYNNENYFKKTSEPISYLEKIQSQSDKLYDGDYEYMFNLSPKNIRNIRKDYVGSNAKNTGFSNFIERDFYIDNNGITRYFSRAIRNNEYYTTAHFQPESAKLRGLSCNNMESYNSDNCEN